MPRKPKPKPLAERKIHLHHNGGAACGAISVNARWPHTVGRVVWPSVVREFKCKMCDRLFRRDNLGTTRTNNRPEPKPAGFSAHQEVST